MGNPNLLVPFAYISKLPSSLMMRCCRQTKLLLWPKTAAVREIILSSAPQPNDIGIMHNLSFSPRSHRSIRYTVFAIRYTFWSPPQTRFRYFRATSLECRLWRRAKSWWFETGYIDLIFILTISANHWRQTVVLPPTLAGGWKWLIKKVFSSIPARRRLWRHSDRLYCRKLLHASVAVIFNVLLLPYPKITLFV